MHTLRHVSPALHGTVGALFQVLRGMITVHPVGGGGKNRICVTAVAVVVVAVALWILNWLRRWSVSSTAAYV